MKPYEFGLLVGRFQTLHNGHSDMIRKAMELCGSVGILVGSSQESGTERNPFPYEVRARLLKLAFGEGVRVAPLPDIGVGNNSAWGEYVLREAERQFGRIPDLFVTGRETRRIDWFDFPEGEAMAHLYVPKTVEISASEMRAFLLEDRREEWERFTEPLLRPEYESLRTLVLAAEGNKETSSL